MIKQEDSIKSAPRLSLALKRINAMAHLDLKVTDLQPGAVEGILHTSRDVGGYFFGSAYQFFKRPQFSISVYADDSGVWHAAAVLKVDGLQADERCQSTLILTYISAGGGQWLTAEELQLVKEKGRKKETV